MGNRLWHVRDLFGARRKPRRRSGRVLGFDLDFDFRSASGRQRRPSLQLESLESRTLLTGIPVISELLASNDRVLYDQDGDDSDWVEVHNVGDDDMSLDRWYLTDNPNDLQQWRFPDVQLEAGGYLIVFASNKDRNDAANELHTNFRLNDGGEYLALVEPDGQTVAFEIAPQYPEQVVDVSYGIPTGTEYSKLFTAGAAARVLIPTDGGLDPSEPDVVQDTWLDPALDDTIGGWFDATTGIGYVPPEEPVLMADSVADFSGVQGQDNWHYGSWLHNFDEDGVYAVGEFNEFSAETFFDAANNKWDLGARSDAEITPEGGHPTSGETGTFAHTVVRRWVSETDGELTIEGTLGNTDPTGDGVEGVISVNGNEVYRQVVNGTSIVYSINVNASLGDYVDFLIGPGAADAETGDGATFTAAIQGVPLKTVPIVTMADAVDDWSRDVIQGNNGWYFGYYSLLDDSDRSYQADDFQQFGSAVWTGTRWQWPGGELDTQIRSSSMAPHGDASVVHWAVRRWQATFSGEVTLQWDLSKSTSSGDGVTGHVFHNGVEVDVAQVAGNDRTGFSRTIVIPGVEEGDTIDFALDPTGIDGNPLQPDGDGDRSAVQLIVSRQADLAPHVNSNIRSAMKDVSSSAYIRIPFQVTETSDLDRLNLRMLYDDGFVAYVNGQQVVAANAPDVARFDSVALEPRLAEDATVFETFDLTSHRDLFLLGDNVLQIHALNASIDDNDLLIAPELVMGTRMVELGEFRYFLTPTPGDSNGLGTDRVGPLVLDVEHTPNVPTQAEPLVITAEVSQTFQDVGGVSLTYHVMYDDPTTVAMVDDGTGGDVTAGDGLFTVTLPAGLAEPGQMIRWYVTAQDTDGINTRFPSFEDPENTEQYQGTIIDDPSAASNLPVFHWFVERYQRAMSGAGARGSIFYDGEFYDNVQFDLHGQSSSGFPTRKKSMNVDMPRDHRLLWAEGLQRMEDFNLLTNFADLAKVRNTLAYEQRAFAGAGYHLAHPIRVHHNGEFFAVYDFVEDPDEVWLDRLDLNPEGALYKMYNSFNSPSGEKKTRKEEGTSDLRDLISGLRLSGAELNNFIHDNVNLAAMVNYLAAFVLTSNRDCCHKNYYAYQDTGVTDEWHFLIWDVDLSQGRNWGGFGRAYFDDTMYPNNALFMGSNNLLIQKVYALPGFREMYLRRVRTLMDAYVKPPGTPREELPLETRVDELYELMKADADLDNEVNPHNWGQTGPQTFEQAIQILLNEYSKPRRDWLYGQTQADDSDVRVILSGEPGEVTARYFVPTDDSLGRSWTQPDFDDSSWASGTTGIGFESASRFEDLITTDIKGQMAGIGSSVYLRVPFDVADPDQIEDLTLRLKVDDGFVAYLNGVEVARDRLRQDEPTFDSTALSRPSAQTTEFFNVVISEHAHLLEAGQNLLAIQGINTSANGNDLLVLPALVEGVVVGGGGEIPKAQHGNPTIDFGTIDFNPVSGNQDEEYISLVNNQDFAVDISGWSLQGDVEITFQAGSVIPAGWTFYTTANTRAFRSRTQGPSGSMQLFVQGNYEGRLANIGGTVELVGADGQLVNATTYVGETTPVQENLRISEVMYNPIGPSAAELSADNSLVADDFEYIELINISQGESLDLQGVRFSNGVTFDFTDSAVTQLAPGERTLVVMNLAAFQTRYGGDLLARVAGEFAAGSSLRASGETITLEDAGGGIVLSFAYSDQTNQGWPERADGDGSSLQIIDPMVDYNVPSNWRPSSKINGSPGSKADAPWSGLVINELLSRPADQAFDQIELFNPTAATVSVAGYFLSDSTASVDALQKFSLLEDTVPSGDYLVFSELDFNAGVGNANGFGLSGTRGDQVYLTVGQNGEPTHFVDSVSFGAAVIGESFGRSPNGSGRLAPMQTNTFGGLNSAPRVGPVVIAELNYAPAAPSDAALAIHAELTADDLEFVEIHNPSATPIELTEWQLRGGVDYDFAIGTVLAAGQTIVVVPFNPDRPDNATRVAAFRTHYGIGPDVILVGGYDGQLNNQGEAVRLQRPDDPQGDPPTIPRLLEDEVFYNDVAPWPVDAAQGGQSLTRVSTDAYGNAAASWIAADPSPGNIGQPTGDLTGDGVVNVDDIDRLNSAIRAGDHQFDLTGDALVDQNDLFYLVQDILGTSIGDANLDGSFGSRDMVVIFQRGEFEDAQAGNSTWADGDWNGDGDFNSDDLLFALQWADYEHRAPAPAIALAAVAAALADNDSVSSVPSDTLADAEVVAVALGPQAAVELELASRESFFQEYGSDLDPDEPQAADADDTLPLHLI